MTEQKPQKYQVTAKRWSHGIAFERTGRLPSGLSGLQVKMEEDALKTLNQYKNRKECTYSFEIK